MPARRVTGLQRQVLHQYKRFLRMIRSKPIDARPAWYQFVAHQFRHKDLGGGLRKMDVGAIEYLLRRGDKMLEGFERPGTKSVSVPDEATHWPLGWAATAPDKRDST
ncbi:hypothetical protein OIV83_005365 [Microbotryomycetes sp. JL201]|nr:hypothetical protein OIV83_005365 [Microbotryomycetes sp. JL201]